MLEIKALTKMVEDWGDEPDDFYFCYHLDVGPLDISNTSDLFSFELISPKRLAKMTADGQIIVGRGHIITSDFKQGMLQESLERIILKCSSDDINKSYDNLAKYFVWEMDE